MTEDGGEAEANRTTGLRIITANRRYERDACAFPMYWHVAQNSTERFSTSGAAVLSWTKV